MTPLQWTLLLAALFRLVAAFRRPERHSLNRSLQISVTFFLSLGSRCQLHLQVNDSSTCDKPWVHLQREMSSGWHLLQVF